MKKNRVPEISVLVVGLSLTLIATLLFYQQCMRTAEYQFKQYSNDTASEIERGLSQYVNNVYDLVAFYNAASRNGSSTVDASDFAIFAESFSRRFPKTQALVWVPYVTHDKRAAFEAANQEKFPGYKITEWHSTNGLVPAPIREEYFPVQYIFPSYGNENEVGFDLASSKERKDMLEHARKVKHLALSSQITLPQGGGQLNIILAALPVYNNENGSLLGFAIGVYRISELINEVVEKNLEPHTIIEFYDSFTSKTNRLLFDTRERIAMDVMESNDWFYFEEHLQLGGHDYALKIKTLPEVFIENRWVPYLIAFIGVLWSFGLYKYLCLTRLKAQQRALLFQSGKLDDERLSLDSKNSCKSFDIYGGEDALTGLSNRRMFDECVEREWKHAADQQFPFSIIVIDIDNFKEFNDQFGHSAGDRCLQQVATVIGGAANRPSDLTARHGGEEFIVALPMADKNGALKIAETIRARVQSLAILHGVGGAGTVVTVSLGVSTVTPKVGDDEVRLVDAAERALEKAKYLGRNRVAMERCRREGEAELDSAKVINQAS